MCAITSRLILHVVTGLSQNSLFAGIFVVTGAVQFLIIEFGGTAFKVTSLDWGQWLVCLVCLLTALWRIGF